VPVLGDCALTTVGREPGKPVPLALLAAAFLFNLGQGVLRPSMPLYLERTFAANYRMVTLIPVVFGAGKWVASLPTGYLLRRLGRPLMICGLLVIACVDVVSMAVTRFDVFLGARGLGGLGWAMFATVATTAMVDRRGAHQRGRSVSLLLISETSGLLLGSAVGGWLYQGVGAASPFLFEAACMIVAAIAVAGWVSRPPASASPSPRPHEHGALVTVLRTPGILLMGTTSALLTAIQTGALVFLFPLYLATRGGVGPEGVGFLVSLGVLGRLAALWLGGELSDRWGRMRILIPGLLIYATLLGSVAVVGDAMILGALSFSIGAAAGLVAAIPTALVGDQVPQELQGVAIGWLRAMTDGGQIVGPLVMGALADAIDLSAPFILGAALLAATACGCRLRAKAMSLADPPV